MLQLEAWRLLDTIGGVTPEVFKTEREVVRNELRQRWETTPGNKMFDLLFESLYPPGHPLRRPVGGTHESLDAAKLEAAQAFVKSYYRPDNCTITIVGDVDTEQVKRLIGTWPAQLLFAAGGADAPATQPRQRVGERPAPPVPAPVTTELKRHRGPIAAPVLLLAWALPPGLRGQDALIDFASSRLDLALDNLDYREEDDIMGASAGAMPLGDSSVMYLQASLRPWADPEKARKRLLDVLMHAWTTEYDKLQTEGNRWSAATGLLRWASDPLSTAAALSEYMAATGKPAYFKDHLDELATIRNNQVSEFAYKWLTRERAVAVYFEPESDKVPTVSAGGSGAGSAGKADSASHDIGRGIAANAAELTGEKVAQGHSTARHQRRPSLYDQQRPGGLRHRATGGAPCGHRHRFAGWKCEYEAGGGRASGKAVEPSWLSKVRRPVPGRRVSGREHRAYQLIVGG
jgi:zinc protease